jgi:hypothetical protein
VPKKTLQSGWSAFITHPTNTTPGLWGSLSRACRVFLIKKTYSSNKGLYKWRKSFFKQRLDARAGLYEREPPGLRLRHTQTFIRQISARVAGAVPYRLLDEASWATQGCAPLFRSAITFAARRALAAGIRRSTCTAAEARFAERTDWLGPDPARCFDCPVDPAPAEQ